MIRDALGTALAFIAMGAVCYLALAVF